MKHVSNIPYLQHVQSTIDHLLPSPPTIHHQETQKTGPKVFKYHQEPTPQIQDILYPYPNSTTSSHPFCFLNPSKSGTNLNSSSPK